MMNQKKSKLWQLCWLTTVLLGLSLHQPSLAQLAPPKNSVSIQGFTYAGRGCPRGSVKVKYGRDRRLSQITFQKFIVEVGRKKTQFPRHSYCTVSFKLKVPRGWSVSWQQVEYGGFAKLSSRVRGQLRTRYYIPGAGEKDAFRIYNFPQRNTFKNYRIVHKGISTAYTPCGAAVTMTVNARLRLVGSSTTDNTLTVKNLIIPRFKWRRC
ncbi:MAG: DUF4360 domain-containing protein [Calothrix sp. MO_192.B10]|nr:DUF4360 domain-containing protein [Calothrix sp. MO_192.B10]